MYICACKLHLNVDCMIKFGMSKIGRPPIIYLSNLHSKNQSCFIFYGEQKCNEIYNLRTTHVPPIIKVTCFNVSLQLRQFFIIYVRRRY